MSTTASCFKGAVRRAEGFTRYALSLQYHGGSFLGVSYQGPDAEDCIVSRYHRKRKKQLIRVDLRGHRSVEGRLREALDDLFGNSNWENIQVSSRTDRGVHALKNTLHVDIRTNDKSPRDGDTNDDDKHASEQGSAGRRNRRRGSDAIESEFSRSQSKIEQKLRDGLNFYLSRQHQKQHQQQLLLLRDVDNQTTALLPPPPPDPRLKQNPMMNELRILNAVRSPAHMDNTEEGKARGQPHRVDWNARFSATQRTYVYRLLLCPDDENDDGGGWQTSSLSSSLLSSSMFGIPFEWDRAWCLAHPLDVRAMQAAAKHLEGTHDFSAFRGRLCQRSTPVVTLHTVAIDAAPPWCGEANRRYPRLVTLSFTANSFLYRQVRNMVGCLVEVGKQGGRLSPDDVRELVRVPASAPSRRANDGPTTEHRENDGSNAGVDAGTDTGESRLAAVPRRYTTAPPQGLFLVDVRHGSFRF